MRQEVYKENTFMSSTGETAANARVAELVARLDKIHKKIQSGTCAGVTADEMKRELRELYGISEV